MGWGAFFCGGGQDVMGGHFLFRRAGPNAFHPRPAQPGTARGPPRPRHGPRPPRPPPRQPCHWHVPAVGLGWQGGGGSRWPGPACSWWGHFSAHDAEASHLFVLVCAASGPPAGNGFSDSVAKEHAIVLRVGTGVAEVYLADLPTPSNPLLKEGQSCRMASTDRDICEPWAIEK